ncbi:hypothetical protein L9F63_004338, partial [Diploptera punctata]
CCCPWLRGRKISGNQAFQTGFWITLNLNLGSLHLMSHVMDSILRISNGNEWKDEHTNEWTPGSIETTCFPRAEDTLTFDFRQVPGNITFLKNLNHQKIEYITIRHNCIKQDVHQLDRRRIRTSSPKPHLKIHSLPFKRKNFICQLEINGYHACLRFRVHLERYKGYTRVPERSPQSL